MCLTRNNLIVFTGPSGVGKGTVVKELFKVLDGVAFSVSATTRKKREGEIEGINYFFKSKEEFEELIKNDELLEWAEFVGNYYGTPKSFVESTLKSKKDVFLEIEVQGALQVKEKFPEAIMIFLLPPSYEELESRLRGRQTESEEILQERLSKAKKEIGMVEKFDYQIINDDIHKASEIIKSIILSKRIISEKTKINFQDFQQMQSLQ
jgi:guanylate kinase